MATGGGKFVSKARVGTVVLLFVLAFLAGYVVGRFTSSVRLPQGTSDGQDRPAREIKWWTCSMHPHIRQPRPGKCPICFMDLVPVAGGVEDVGERRISFSEAAIKLMEVETSRVERKFVTAAIRMVGKVNYDETRLKNITTWVAGRIDRLYVDFTGITVNKGDHMVELYSPELISAQAELLQAVRAADGIKPETSDFVRRTTAATLEATREKLRLLGLTAEQVEQMQRSGKTVTHVEIKAPIGGIVIHKNAVEGMYVETGTPVYTIADLSKVWVELDAYESDLSWIRYGQAVEFQTEAYPGEVFKGRIIFIDPILNPKTRTVKLRVNVDNPEGRLKPEMFVSAVVYSKVAKGGRVMAPEMAGKWVCPMHPGVIKDSSGDCDICGMDLVKAESLGYAIADAESEPPLVVPVSAALITGTRAVVYVRIPQTEKPTFEGREVVLGARAGDYYVVNSGLEEGEVVVTRGNFKIDSALQIQARPSMMSPQGQAAPVGHKEHSH